MQIKPHPYDVSLWLSHILHKDTCSTHSKHWVTANPTPEVTSKSFKFGYLALPLLCASKTLKRNAFNKYNSNAIKPVAQIELMFVFCKNRPCFLYLQITTMCSTNTEVSLMLQQPRNICSMIQTFKKKVKAHTMQVNELQLTVRRCFYMLRYQSVIVSRHRGRRLC